MKANAFSKDTAGQMVHLEIKQVCLSAKPKPSTSKLYVVSLVLDSIVMTTCGSKNKYHGVKKGLGIMAVNLLECHLLFYLFISRPK